MGLGSPGHSLTSWSVNTDGDNPRGFQNGNSLFAGPTPYGKQWVVVNEDPGNDWIQQTVSGLTPGQQYDLKFSLASESEISSLTAGTGSEVEVSIFGAGTLSATYQAFQTPGNYWQRWSDHVFSFVADSATLTFRFAGGPTPAATILASTMCL